MSTQRTADKLNDFLMNPKSRPDLQTPEAQAFLRHLETHYHNEKTDALMPWLTREWKKGRLIVRGKHGDAGDTNPKLHFWERDPGEPDPNASSHVLHPLPPSALNHWGDFMRSNHPLQRETGDIMQHHILPFAHRVDAWEEAMMQAAQQADTERLKGHGKVVHTTPEGYTVRQLTTPEELKAEGDTMGHCVGGYADDVAKGKTLIYSLRDPTGAPHATAEIAPMRERQLNPDIGWLEHAFGDQNGPALDEMREFHRRTTDPDHPWYQQYGDLIGHEERYDQLARKHGLLPPPPHGGEIVQVQGKGNAVPIPKYQQQLKHWFTSFPEEDRPHWGANEASTLAELEPTDEMGGYTPHGDYGVPTSPPDYHSIIKNLPQGSSGRRFFDYGDAEKLYQYALKNRHIPELAKGLDDYHNDTVIPEQDHIRDHHPEDLGYPGEDWEEDPERWEQHAAEEGYDDPTEAFDSARRNYEENEKYLYDEHAPSQIDEALASQLKRHWNSQAGGFINEPQYLTYAERQLPPEQQPQIQPPAPPLEPRQPPPQQLTFAKTASAIPPAPGTSPIPPGHVRLWHYTGSDPEQIRQQGLRLENAKGETYGEPNRIWASSKPPSFDNHHVVEFSVHRDDPRWDIGKYEPYINYSYRDGGDSRTDPAFDYGQHLQDNSTHVTFTGDIRPEEILAVHEPWHQSYRYLTENYPTAESTENMGGPEAFDWAMRDDPEGLGRAVQAWKATLPQQGTPPVTSAHIAASPLYKRWVFSPASGNVELQDNSGHPLDVKYHTDLARELNEPNLVHGYAYRIGGGWRLTDWESQPVSDPYVVASVMRALKGAEPGSGPQEGWEDVSGEDWSRVHHGLPT